MPTSDRYASVIVPAFREAPNLEPLTQRLFAATRGAGWTIELIIVDDNSQDGTEETVERLASEGFDVKVVVRRTERGLSSAVLAGFAHAKFEKLAVMDADLQHPPEIMPELLEKLGGDCDFVIATRYAQSGGVDSDWPLRRKVASKAATLVALPLAKLSDPMSGCFALTKATLHRAKRLDPLGYKIALELFVKCGCRKACEVPIQFAARTAGESKASFAEGMRFLRHLGRLYRFRYLGGSEAVR